MVERDSHGRAPPLPHGIAFTLLGNGLFNLCRLIAAPVLLAKFSTDAVLGQYETGMAVAAPLVLFAFLELRAVFVADVGGEFSFGTYRALRNVALIVATVGVLLSIALTTGWGEGLSMAAILLGVCGLRLAYQSAELYWGVYQKRERLDRLAGSNALRGIAMLAAFGVCVPVYGLLVWRGSIAPSRLAEGAALAVWTTVAAWAAINWFVDRRETLRDGSLDPAWTWTGVAALARHALPLGLVAALISLCENVPRWFIRADVNGLESLGRFAALVYLPLAAHFVMLQIGLAAQSRLATQHRDDPAAFRRLARTLVLIALSLGAAVFASVWALGPGLLRIVYRAEYAAEFDAFLVLVGGQCIILLASVFGYCLTQMRIFWVQVPIHATVLAATTFAAWLLIPYDPIGGGAWTMLIRAAVQTLLYGTILILALRRQRGFDRAVRDPE